MKKIYLIALSVIASFAVAASGTVKLSLNPKRIATENAVARNSQPGNGISQIAASITCGTNYSAGTTQTLNFTLTFTNMASGDPTWK